MAVDKVIKDYRNTLNDLTRNDKMRINVLTILAEDYAQFASHIVTLIEDAIFEADNITLKMIRLYLIDSIVKNVTSAGDYADLFSDNLVKVFLHVFQRGDEKVRRSLYKLRNTWQNVFPRGKLYSLDVEVHTVDENWPIVSPQKNGQVNKKPTPPAPAAKTEPPPPRSAPPTVATNPVTENARTGNGSANGQKNWRIYINPHFVKEPPAKKARTDAPLLPDKPARQDKSSAMSRNQHRPHKRTTPPINDRGLPKPQNVPVMEPTAAPGLHAFDIPPTPIVQPPIVPPSIVQPSIVQPSIVQSSIVQSSIVPPSIVQQQPMASSIPSPQIFASIPNLPVTTIVNMSAPAISTQSSMVTSSMNMSIVPPHNYMPPPQIRNEAPRLPNLPSNNRIFVDGKAYEVFYLDNNAVIERNGVPHRISFCGPPRDVVIDGTPHRMAFGETKAVSIDGQTHYLRFGAPSRELYMGDFAFKGAFGGPPIAATINGRRHEIRLGGPPPEVKIEQDPCYELIRHLQNLRQNNPLEVPQPKKEDKDMKIGDLLAKLQKTGVLDTLTSAMKSAEKPAFPSYPTHTSSSFQREPTPPIIPSSVKMDKFEVRDKPVTLLSQFYMPDLKIRYQSVIRSIHRQRSACPDCGIFFEDTTLPPYRGHLDQHIQIDINSSTMIHPMGNSRQRYLDEEQWVAYSKVDKLNNSDASAILNGMASSDESTDEDEELE